jgi:hypothetical protein
VDRLGRLAPIAALLFVAALQIHRLDDADTWWHLASGRLIAGTQRIATGDPFSFTAPGAPWVNRQWLFDLGIFGLWRLAGAAGPILGAGAAFTAAFACLYVVARRRMPAWAAAALVGLAAAAAAERFTVRPESVTFCLLGVYVLLLDRPLGWGRAALLVALQVVWANTHALSVLGLVPLGATLLAALARALMRGGERVPLGPIAAATAGAILAEAATPWGVRGALFPLVLLRDISGGELVSYTIVEHRRTSLAALSPTAGAAFVALLAVGAASLVASLRRVPVAPLFMAGAFTVAAFLARRNVALLGFGIVPLAAYGLGPAALALQEWLGRRSRMLATAPAVLVSLVFLVETARVVHGDWYETARLTRTFGLGSSLLLYPQGAVEFLERAAPEARVLNDDLQGGLLLWNGYPQRRVFIDGRVQVYPPEVNRDWQRVLDDPRTFPEVAARWQIGAVLLHHPSPGRLELAAAIARMPGWRVAYLDGGGIVLLADGKPPAEPEGIAGPTPAAATSGMSDVVEMLVSPLRPATEQAMAFYQRGRAIHFLFGPPGYPAARADFDAALRLVPDYAAARKGLAATGSAAGGVQR